MQNVRPEEAREFMQLAEQHFRELNLCFSPSADWRAHYFASLQNRPDRWARWLIVEGNKAGFVIYGIEPHRFLPRHTGVVYELYIRPEYRRLGIARECGTQVIATLKKQGPSKIQLEVLEGNTAADALWSQLGFKTVSKRMVLSEGSK